MSRTSYTRYKGALMPALPPSGEMMVWQVGPKRVLVYGTLAHQGPTFAGIAAVEVMLREGLGWERSIFATGPDYVCGASVALADGIEELEAWRQELREVMASRHPTDPVLAWKRGPDVGLIAMTLCRACEGVRVDDPSLPKDAADLRRCHTMLEAPGLGLDAEIWRPS